MNDRYKLLKTFFDNYLPLIVDRSTSFGALQSRLDSLQYCVDFSEVIQNNNLRKNI